MQYDPMQPTDRMNCVTGRNHSSAAGETMAVWHHGDPAETGECEGGPTWKTPAGRGVTSTKAVRLTTQCIQIFASGSECILWFQCRCVTMIFWFGHCVCSLTTPDFPFPSKFYSSASKCQLRYEFRITCSTKTWMRKQSWIQQMFYLERSRSTLVGVSYLIVCWTTVVLYIVLRPCFDPGKRRGHSTQ